MRESRLTKVDPAKGNKGTETNKKKNDVFQNEFESDTSKMGTFTPAVEPGNIPVLQTAKLYPYKPKKFSADYGSLGLNNAVLINRYQAYQNGSGPITLNSGSPLNGLISLGTSDLMEDIKFTGGFKLSTNLKDNEWLGNYQNLKRRIDWGVSYYRNVQGLDVPKDSTFASLFLGKVFTNLYQVNVAYPFNNNKSIRISTGLRSDKTVVASGEQETLLFPDIKKMYSVSHIEYVYDNSLKPAMNIWEGLRYKVFFDYNKQVSKQKKGVGPSTYNLGFDARYYYPIYRHFTWALRGAADFSWGNQKMIYYLGGVDGWLMFGPNQKFDAMGNPKGERFFNTNNPPDQDQDYAFQSLAVNMRGFIQNVANGNNALVINSEFRLPIISTFFDKTVNNAFIRNFQLIQFTDFGAAWNGKYDKITRPTMVFADPVNSGQTPPVLVKVKAGGIGPLAGGYGFGARSTLLGYFLKFDAAWQMNGFFKGKPIMYFALGLDF